MKLVAITVLIFEIISFTQLSYAQNTQPENSDDHNECYLANVTFLPWGSIPFDKLQPKQKKLRQLYLNLLEKAKLNLKEETQSYRAMMGEKIQKIESFKVVIENIDKALAREYYKIGPQSVLGNMIQSQKQLDREEEYKLLAAIPSQDLNEDEKDRLQYLRSLPMIKAPIVEKIIALENLKQNSLTELNEIIKDYELASQSVEEKSYRLLTKRIVNLKDEIHAVKKYLKIPTKRR